MRSAGLLRTARQNVPACTMDGLGNVIPMCTSAVLLAAVKTALKQSWRAVAVAVSVDCSQRLGGSAGFSEDL
jgi:hypothetical protein